MSAAATVPQAEMSANADAAVILAAITEQEQLARRFKFTSKKARRKFVHGLKTCAQTLYTMLVNVTLLPTVNKRHSRLIKQTRLLARLIITK